MLREQLEHVLRAAAAIALEKSFVVVGSQAVLLAFPNAPAELLLSNEVDLYPALHPERAELIERSKLQVDKLVAWAGRRAFEATQP